MRNINEYISELNSGNKLALARCITIVENELNGFKEILQSLTFENKVPIIGITGPPGAGKSSLVNALISHILSSKKDSKIGIIAIDPTSPFNKGSILGDRVRMGTHFNNPNVFIRSIATRGSLGGLSARIIEIADVMKASDFDFIFVETVGVGQSEIEIVGLADITVVVLVPEAGDDIQAIKSGIMEIADIFVVNKSDRTGANTFMKGLGEMLHSSTKTKSIDIVKTVATKDEGIDELFTAILKLHLSSHQNEHKYYLLCEKIYTLIQHQKMKGIDKDEILKALKSTEKIEHLNIYQFAKMYY